MNEWMATKDLPVRVFVCFGLRVFSELFLIIYTIKHIELYANIKIAMWFWLFCSIISERALKWLGNIVQMRENGAIKGIDFNAICTLKDNLKVWVKKDHYWW